MDELQAAILRVKLKNLDNDNKLRQQHSKKYNLLLKDLPIELPAKRESCTHVYHLFVIKSNERDELKDYLHNNGVITTIQYPVPVHRQKYYQEIVGEISLPITEQAAEIILSLPMYPELTTAEISQTIDAIKGYYGG